MTPELGHLGLICAFFFSCAQSLAGAMGILSKNTTLLGLVKPAQYAAFLTTAFAFFSLIWAFVTSDFSFSLVAQHSHSLKPLIYKISGTWGNHEGSLLLWVLILNLFGALFCLTKTPLETRLSTAIISVQSTISIAFLAFSLLSSNPFQRMENVPIEGQGLNPILQDIGLALHPPTLYLGYVGLSIAFSFAVAGLVCGRVEHTIDRAWAIALKPWVSTAWCALTAGIALGSWWAYYELGWGGWWFWDPVENVSLMPWLIATALLHSLRVIETREMFKSWTVLLAILGFSLSLLGTFIVRSGLLTSVHSFASDPERGIFILGILLVSTGIPLLLYLWRAPRSSPGSDFALNSREMSLLLNNTVLVCCMLIVLLGTFYPMALELWNGKKITVGPPYFNTTFQPLMAVGLVGAGIAGIFAWRRGILAHGKKTLLSAGLCTLLVVVVLTTTNLTPFSLAGLAVLTWLTSGIVWDIFYRLKFQKPQVLKRVVNLGTGVWGMWIAHLGLAVFLAGAMGEHLLQQEQIVRVKVGERIDLGDREYEFASIAQSVGPNYETLKAELVLRDKTGEILATLYPERRFYPAERQTTTEAAIRSTFRGDDYAVLGDGDTTSGFSLRLYHKPLVTWIWLGAILLIAGGGLAGFSRRKETL